MAGGVALPAKPLATGYLKGRALIFPLCLIISLFFLWGFSYGLLDVLNKHFQVVLKITKLQSTGLQVAYFGAYFVFSPVAAEVMKRYGYKKTVLMGLFFYSLGAIFFWPTAHYSSAAHKAASFGGFIACTFVIACGLATLETAANSYATVIVAPAWSSFNVQFCQSFNGVGSFIGPFIASRYFFTGANANNLVNVQFVYLAVAIAGAADFVVFLMTKLPEVSREESMDEEEQEEDLGRGPIWKEYNLICATLSQFCYVGAQVTVASFFINYATENADFSSATASNLLSYALIIFTVGRFFATTLTVVFQSDFLLIIFASLAIGLNIYIILGHGKGAVGTLMCLFLMEAPMYPMNFALGTANLGKHTRRGSGIIVMAVSGGAVFPPIQGAVADSIGTRSSYIVPLVGFVGVLFYVTAHWLIHGRRVLRVKPKAEPEVSKDPEVSKVDTGISKVKTGVSKDPEVSKVDTGISKVKTGVSKTDSESSTAEPQP